MFAPEKIHCNFYSVTIVIGLSLPIFILEVLQSRSRVYFADFTLRVSFKDILFLSCLTPTYTKRTISNNFLQSKYHNKSVLVNKLHIHNKHQYVLVICIWLIRVNKDCIIYVYLILYIIKYKHVANKFCTDVNGTSINE